METVAVLLTAVRDMAITVLFGYGVKLLHVQLQLREAERDAYKATIQHLERLQASALAT